MSNTKDPEAADTNQTESIRAVVLPRFVRPSRITEEMVRLATGNGEYGPLPIDPWHIAANLNAMMADGYCPKCGLCPSGCEREACGPNVLAHTQEGRERGPDNTENK